ncbi:hypothetical protein DUI87_16099 [Hirundo rustica rustica]|uniref:Uncharacterized protein n=1 Tax=Hirundo rustica rustica TaxID=333673 RepID=A0A3M0K2N5_HIRRU|nr:hypothetical protein DUI87_16099 [Hirundo rustica rustica]
MRCCSSGSGTEQRCPSNTWWQREWMAFKYLVAERVDGFQIPGGGERGWLSNTWWWRERMAEGLVGGPLLASAATLGTWQALASLKGLLLLRRPLDHAEFWEEMLPLPPVKYGPLGKAEKPEPAQQA